MDAMRILGIDPGLQTTGYGILQAEHRRLSIVEAGVIRARPAQDLAMRLQELFDGVAELMDALKPDVAAIEELYSHYERPKTAILMGHARGVLILAIGRSGIPVYSYSATQIKRILTGSGRASKLQVQTAVARQLELPRIPEPPDVADALATAICHHFLAAKASRT
jgi:crossover junction endodeoxyribonuclease RuvC